MDWSQIIKKFNIFFVIILLLPALTTQKRHIRIGGIFHTDNNESEIAFKYAIDRINMYNHKVELVPVVHNVEKTDSFKAGKIACSLAEQGVAAIIGPQSVTTNHIVKSVANNLEIPHIQAFWDAQQTINSLDSVYGGDGSGPKTVINLYPDAGVLAIAYADLLKVMGWNTFTIIYQHDEALIRLQEVLKSHGPHDLPVTVRQLGDENNYRELLKEIKSTAESHFVLDIDVDRLLDFFHQANEVKMMEEYQSYVITSLDTHTIDFGIFKYGRTNITAMRIVDPTSSETINAAHDWKVGEERNNRRIDITADNVKLETALTYDAVNFFASAITDLDPKPKIEPLACKSQKRSSYGFRITQYMKVRNEHGVTGNIQLDDSGRRRQFTLEVIELSRDGFKKIGTWDPTTGVNYTRTYGEIYTQIVESLHNKTFKVTSRIGAPFLMWRKPKDGEILEGNDRFEGYAMDLIDGISKLLGFKYEFELVPDNKYGNYDKTTKKWNGLIKRLLDRQADLAICDLTITYERRSAVDFTMPFMTLGISILYSKPIKQPPNLFSFMLPFSMDVWFLMLIGFIAVSVFLFIIARMNPQDWENPHPCNPDPEELENIWGLKNCVWLTLGSIMAQGCDILPKGSSTRFATGTWWFFSLIMISSYTANLAAFLTMEKMEATIQNVEDLAKQTKIQYGALTGGSTANFFKGSNFSIYQKIWTVMDGAKPSVFTDTNDEGVERVAKGKSLYAFFMESTSIEYQIERNCDLTQIGGLLDSKGYGIAMPVNSPYRTAVSGAVLTMQEQGSLHMLKAKWWREIIEGEACSKMSESDKEVDSNELGIANVGGVFVVLGLGCSAAFGVALLEFFWNVRKVAVDNMISPCDALMCELKFALQLCNTTKPVNTKTSTDSNPSSRSSGDSDNRSVAANMLKTAGSFLRLDTMFDKK